MVSCNQQPESKSKQETTNNCDFVKVYIDELLELKIQYEKDIDMNDSLNLINDQINYQQKLERMRDSVDLYLPCLNEMLLNKTEDKLVMFNYVSPIESSPDECDYINYSEYLLLLISYLERNDESDELSCPLAVVSE